MGAYQSVSLSDWHHIFWSEGPKFYNIYIYWQLFVISMDQEVANHFGCTLDDLQARCKRILWIAATFCLHTHIYIYLYIYIYCHISKYILICIYIYIYTICKFASYSWQTHTCCTWTCLYTWTARYFCKPVLQKCFRSDLSMARSVLLQPMDIRSIYPARKWPGPQCIQFSTVIYICIYIYIVFICYNICIYIYIVYMLWYIYMEAIYI